jgi:hypothetical protein
MLTIAKCLFEDAGHLAEQIQCNEIIFAQIDTECMEREHCSLSESAAPDGVSGFVEINDEFLSFVTELRVKRKISNTTTIRLFAFYRDNAVAAFRASETTEPKLRCSILLYG